MLVATTFRWLRICVVFPLMLQPLANGLADPLGPAIAVIQLVVYRFNQLPIHGYSDVFVFRHMSSVVIYLLSYWAAYRGNYLPHTHITTKANIKGHHVVGVVR